LPPDRSASIFPSSCNIKIATPVIGFVIEAIQNNVSAVIGRFDSTSANPVVCKSKTLSLATTNVTAPAISFFAIISSIAALTGDAFRSAAQMDSSKANANVVAKNLDGFIALTQASPECAVKFGDCVS
jgi:hypothetical protein